MTVDLYFYNQSEFRKIPKRYRKLPEELPESLRFAHLNPKVAALLANKERAHKQDKEDPFGDGLGQKSLLPDINSAFQNVRNQFDSALSNDEDSQRYLFEEAKYSAQGILEQLSRIIYFYEDLYKFIPKSLECQILSGYNELTADVTVVPREWQTQEMKEQYAASLQREAASDLEDYDEELSRPRSRMGTDKSVSEFGSRLNIKKTRPRLGVIEASPEEDSFPVPESRAGRKTSSRQSILSQNKLHLDMHASRMGSRVRKGSIMSGFSPSVHKGRMRDDVFSMIDETPSDLRSTAMAGPLSYMQTINFQLSNKSFEEKGWIMLKGRHEEVDPSAVIEHCVARLQEAMKQAAAFRQKEIELGYDKAVAVRYYGDTRKETVLKFRKSPTKANTTNVHKGGKPRIPSISDEKNEGKKLMQVTHIDGTTLIYYPSGRPAVVHSAAGYGRPGYYTIVYDDGLDSRMVACFTPSGKGVCYHPNGVVRFLATEKGGHLSGDNGAVEKKWKWPQQGVFKNIDPISCQVTPHVMFRCVGRGQMTIVFSCQKEVARFSVSPSPGAEDYKPGEDTEQLLTAFTFSSKTAKDLMRIFAPTKKQKKSKGRKPLISGLLEKIYKEVTTDSKAEDKPEDEAKSEKPKEKPKEETKKPKLDKELTHIIKKKYAQKESLDVYMASDEKEQPVVAGKQPLETQKESDQVIAKIVMQYASREFLKQELSATEKEPQLEEETKALRQEEKLRGWETSEHEPAKDETTDLISGNVELLHTPSGSTEEENEEEEEEIGEEEEIKEEEEEIKEEEEIEEEEIPEHIKILRRRRGAVEYSLIKQPETVADAEKDAKDKYFKRNRETQASEFQGKKDIQDDKKSEKSKENLEIPRVGFSATASGSKLSEKEGRSISSAKERSRCNLPVQAKLSPKDATSGVHAHATGTRFSVKTARSVSAKETRNKLPIKDTRTSVSAKETKQSASVKHRKYITRDQEKCRMLSDESIAVKNIKSSVKKEKSKKVKKDLDKVQGKAEGSDIDKDKNVRFKEEKHRIRERVCAACGRQEDIYYPSKSQTSEIVKLLHDFPDKVTYELEADKELARLQRKARNLVDDWLEHYRLAIGLSMPSLQSVSERWNYSIATRHAKSAKQSEHGLMIRKAVLGVDDDENVKKSRVPSAPLAGRLTGILVSSPPFVPSLYIKKRSPTPSLPPSTPRLLLSGLSGEKYEEEDDDLLDVPIDTKRDSMVTFEEPRDAGGDTGMVPSAVAMINRMADTASRRSARSKASSARSVSPSRQSVFTSFSERIPSALSGNRSHCPLVIRQQILGYDKPQCRCSRHHIPFIMDLELDEYVSTEVPEGQLIVIMVVSSLFPGITNAEEMLNEIYQNQNRNRTRPCVQSRSDMFRVFKYDINTAADMSDHTQPLLLTRHSVVPGMFLMYCDGRLLFCDHIFNGYGNNRRDFKKQVMKSRHDAIQCNYLPKDFKFSPSRGRSGLRSAWGGEIGGAGVDKYSSPGTVLDSSLVPIHRPISSSTGNSKDEEIDAVRLEEAAKILATSLSSTGFQQMSLLRLVPQPPVQGTTV